MLPPCRGGSRVTPFAACGLEGVEAEASVGAVDAPHDVLDIALVGHVARPIPVFVGEAEVVFREEVSEGLKARDDAVSREEYRRSRLV